MNRAPRYVAVIGRNGQLARELADLTWPGDLRPRFLGRGDIDLCDPSEVLSHLRALRPAAVINTAAHTAVDLCEAEPELAMRLNAEIPGNLARATQRIGVPLIHISTDYVFSGDQHVAYREEDPTAPLSAYARSKLAGEQAVLGLGAPAMIVRSAGLFGRHGQNFLKTIVAKASGGGQPITMVADQVSTPTPAAALAAALQQMAIDLSQGRSLPQLLHFTGQPAVSWFDFAAAILTAVAKTRTAPLPELIPVHIADYPRPARRPIFSALDCSLAQRQGYAPPDWRTALDPLVADLNKERIAA